jgi:protein TonB
MKSFLSFLIFLFLSGSLLSQPETPIKEPINASLVEELPRFRPQRNLTSEEAENDLMLYLAKHTRYPTKAYEKGISGKVMVQFEVLQNGKVSEAIVIKGVHPWLDKEALKVVRKLPRFSPGRQNGKPVRVRYVLPVNFKISKD